MVDCDGFADEGASGLNEFFIYVLTFVSANDVASQRDTFDAYRVLARIHNFELWSHPVEAFSYVQGNASTLASSCFTVSSKLISLTF